MKVFLRIVTILIPVLFLVGLIRFMINGWEGDFVPSWGSFLAWFDSFPDVVADWNMAIRKFNASEVLCSVGDGSFGDSWNYYWCSTWNSFANWFSGFSSLIGVILSVPFKVLGWFFSIFTI